MDELEKIGLEAIVNIFESENKKYACSLFGFGEHELIDDCLIDTNGKCEFVSWSKKEHCGNWVNIDTKKHDTKPAYPYEKVREFLIALSQSKSWLANAICLSKLSGLTIPTSASQILEEINESELPY